MPRSALADVSSPSPSSHSPYGSAGSPSESVLIGVAPGNPGMLGSAGVVSPGMVDRARVGEGLGEGDSSSGRGSSERVIVAAARWPLYQASKPSRARRAAVLAEGMPVDRESTIAQASLVSGYSPTRPSTGCVEDHLEPLRSVRRRSARTPVATGYCYRLRTEEAGFWPQQRPFHAQNRGGEAGIRTLGPCGSAVFKTAAIDRSATSPRGRWLVYPTPTGCRPGRSRRRR